MKVVHVSQRDDLATGGALRVAYEFVRRLPDFGIDARMLFLYGSAGYVGSKLPDVCDYLGIENSSQVGKFWRLNDYLRKVSPEIVHFHDDLVWPQLVTSGTHNWKRVIHAHGGGTPAPQPLKTRILYHFHRNNADAVVCITEEAKASQVANVGYEKNRLSVIYNAIDRGHYSCPTELEMVSSRKRFGLPEKAQVVGFVGRLHNDMKGCDDFLRVLAMLPSNHFGLIAGIGPDERNLRNQAGDLGLKDRVVFTGLLDDTVPAYHAMNAFCFVSRHEPFGLTLAEAMACGLPVVGFSCPGGSGEILTVDTGDVIAGRDLSLMAESLKKACALESPWPSKLQRAQQLLREKFDWDLSTHRLSVLYRELFGDKPVSARSSEA